MCARAFVLTIQSHWAVYVCCMSGQTNASPGGSIPSMLHRACWWGPPVSARLSTCPCTRTRMVRAEQALVGTEVKVERERESVCVCVCVCVREQGEEEG